ncbi:MAG: SDR family NAD(P)-dependent oxidoreductase [Myxococcota bacterium]|nr:SDR family NAD(P)-dependent oxidoreductase [Myxococcota bacterium]
MTSSVREPIAIVGIGCRLPGGIDSANALADMLLARRSAVREVPPDRWLVDAFYHPDFKKPGFIHARRGGFVDGVDQFDAAFFGISPHEARRMDPQQRWALECALRAIEDAGMPLERLAGRPVAVMVGCSGHDYDAVQVTHAGRTGIGPTTNTGSALSIVSNRISYMFDLRGPSFTVDTACSSSLYAFHHACRAIWSGDAEAALAGGVNLVLKPEPTIGFSKGSYLSPDGECRAFSDHANGYVRSEGAAMLFLKPLSAALADGDRIYALVRGSALNQDGRTPGMTLPSGDAQQAMLETAYRDAGIDPREVSYVEAHGTGTPAGDPIEAGAIGRVVGVGREDTCFIGSIKTNIGHLESASGVAGLIKLALTLQRRTVFPNLHFRAPNPDIPFEELHLRVPTEAQPITKPGPIYGGVNSFGFGGSNAHVVLESPPEVDVRPSTQLACHALFVSARTPAALRGYASELASRLDSTLCIEHGDSSSEVVVDAIEVADVANAQSHRRSRFELRAAVVGHTRAELVAALRALDEQPLHGRYPEGRAAQPIAFVFTGQGPQWWRMGRELFAASPIFRATVERIDAALHALGWLASDGSSLIAELHRDEASSRIGETRIAQPCIYALQVGLVEMLRAHGVTPSAVVGHSIGELAAAVCVGVISASEGARIVYWRSRCQAQAEGAGCMAAVGVSEAEAREFCVAGKIEIAAINGPRIVTVAGTHAAVDALIADLDRRDIFCKKLAVSVPFHCWLMDPIERDFRAGLSRVETRAAVLPFYSTVTGARTEQLDVDYWWQNIREPVRFHAGIEALAKDGFTTFVEIGPHPVLARGAHETLQGTGIKGTIIETLRHHADEPAQFARLLGKLFVVGAAVHATPDEHCSFIELPQHPLEPTRHWLETEADRKERIGADRVHPHVANVERGVKSTATFDCTLAVDPKDEPYLMDHQVQGVVVFPGAGQIETILSAGRQVFGDDIFLEEVEFLRPLVVEAESEAAYRLDVYSDEGHFTLGALADREANAWLEYSRGRINRSDRFASATCDVADWQARCSREFDASEFYKGAAASGLELGPAFQVIRHVWVSAARETLSLVEPTEALAHEIARFYVHPAILDGVLQTAAIGMLAGTDKHALFLPQRVARARLHAPYRGQPLWCHSRITHDRAKDVTLDVWAVLADGTPIVSLEGLVVRRVRGTSKADRRAFYEPRWQPAPLETGELATRTTAEIAVPVRGTWLVIGGGAIANRIAGALESRGNQVLVDEAPDLARAPGRIVGIVHLATIGVSDWQRAVERGPVAMGELLTQIGERGLWTEDGAAIWLVTSGVTADANAPFGAPLWGFGRVLGSEQPRHATTLVDLSASATFADVDALVDEIVAGPREHEIAIRDGVRYVQTLEPVAADGERSAQDVEIARTSVRAVVTTPGNIASIKLERQPEQLLDPDEILVDVRAIGLNFKDVVVATAMLGDEAWENGMSGATIGMDCAGVVLAVGANVGEFAIGDEVVGLAPACAGNRAVAHRRHLVKKPATLGFTDAAAVPTAYVTAGIALERLARLTAGETVLIHAAAGGVGIAAISIAQRLGARVFATTSSEDKRTFLRSLGVEYIFNSRSPEFRDDIMVASGGRGVDVVLNSVAGQLLTQSLRCLAPFGRFVEIGKADLYANRQLGLKFFAENRSFICFDLNRLAAKKEPELAERLGHDLARIADGTYARIPVRAFPLTQTADAVHALAQGKAIGKIVVEVPRSGTVPALPETTLAFDRAKTWIVTGGCGGFGLAAAEWLASKGARHIALWGRRGLPGDEERAVVEGMRAKGVDVIVTRCDVRDRDQVESRLAELRAQRPIGGVFHGAMVLDDAPISALDRGRYAAVTAPKLNGAWHLHEATRGDQLEQFVLFSSIASIVGTPGQANYAAANAGLDAIAAHRNALGLPATSINWGVLDIGVVARASADQRRKILGQGVEAFSVPEALALLERTLLDRPAQRVVARIDWKRLARIGARKDRAGRFAALSSETAQSASGRLADQLAQTADAERANLVAKKVATLVAQVAGLGTATVDLDAGLDRFGFDSLMATQLQSWIDGEVGITVPLVRLLRRPSIRDLSAEIVAGWKRSSKSDAEELIRRPEPRPDAKARLFCLPPMGADASIFTDWIGALPPEIELCTLSLPKLDGPLGHLIGNAEDLREHVLERMEPLLDVPFAIYGHSLGGWLALDLADALRERGRAARFVALGALPTLDTMRSLIPDDVTAADQITDAHVRAAMERMAIPHDALSIAPMVRRDLWLGAAARAGGVDFGRAQPAPVILMGGDTDPIITVDKGTQTIYGAPPDEVWRLPGGHFFLAEEASQSTMHRHLRSLAGRLID